MKDSLTWVIVLLILLTSGIFLILMLIPLGVDSESVLLTTYRFIAVFHGVLAGVSIGEYLKIRTKEREGKNLLIDLVEELRVNETLLDSENKLRKGFWILGIRSGLARYLPNRERRMLWNIYSNITHYNEEVELLHRARLDGKDEFLTPDFLNEISELRDEIRKNIEIVKSRHSTDDYF